MFVSVARRGDKTPSQKENRNGVKVGVPGVKLGINSLMVKALSFNPPSHKAFGGHDKCRMSALMSHLRKLVNLVLLKRREKLTIFMELLL